LDHYAKVSSVERNRNELKLLLALAALACVLILSASLTLAADMSGLMMGGGKVRIVEQGKRSTPIQHEMKLTDGSTLKPDGTILRDNASEVHLHDGDVIMPDGHIMHGGKAAPMCH
jgi:hypothetical protein